MDCVKCPNIVAIEDIKWDVISTTLSTLYGILIISIYAAFSYTELVKFPEFNHWLETNGFFIYLYLASIIYLIYMLVVVLKGTSNKTKNQDAPLKVVENEEVR